MAKKFAGQVVLITGASAGIGAQLAREFHQEGAVVALCARRTELLEELAVEMKDRAHVYPMDVTDHSQVEAVCAKVAADLGKIDIVVANAGYVVSGPFEALSEAMWRKQFETNVFGVVWTCQAALPFLKITKGRLVIMSSVAGMISSRKMSAYNASKFALVGLANCLYQELYPYGITVTNIAPGMVESQIAKVDNLGAFVKDRADKRPARFLMPTALAAKEMLVGIYQRKRCVVITGHGKFAAFLASYLPGLTYWTLRRSSFRAEL